MKERPAKAAPARRSSAFFAAVRLLAAAGALPAAMAGAAPPGVVSHILVLSDKCEDVSGPEAWKRTCILPGMSDREKALAIWRTVVRYRHQTNPPNEYHGPDRNVHDPFKTIHVYGYCMCCCAAADVCGLARLLDMPARGKNIKNHTVSEVFHGGAWHMLDGSLMNYFTRPDGEIAGVEEIAAAVRAWHDANPGYRDDADKLLRFAAGWNWRANGPPLLATYPHAQADGRNLAGVHGWHASMIEYDIAESSEYECGPSMGYALNVQLREGERLTRNWFNKGMVIDWTDADILAGGEHILGLQRQLGDRAPGRIGNGTAEYDVPLADGAFRRAALQADNLVCRAEAGGRGPAVAVGDAAADGILTLRMPSSYVYLAATATAQTVVPPGGAVEVFFSDNQGTSWRSLTNWNASGAHLLDISPHVHRRYDYRLRLHLRGAGTGLDALRIAADIQHSQAPLPVITEGLNTIVFHAGPSEGTITYEGSTDPGVYAGKQVGIHDYQPVLENMQQMHLRPQGEGQATFRVRTPGDLTRLRMNVFHRCRDAADRWNVQVSFDDGATFRAVAELAGPTVGNTRYIIVDDVPAGRREALVRLAGRERNTCAIFSLRIDADYREPAGGFRPVQIVYVWTEDGQEKRDVHVATRPEETYTITCGPKTVARSFSVELAPAASTRLSAQ